jgi:hypothetical protein
MHQLAFSVMVGGNKMLRSLRRLSICAVLLLTCSHERAAEWTIMVYLNGDNALQNSAMEDFSEFASVGSASDVNVVVQFDRQGPSSNDASWGQTLRFYVKKNIIPLPATACQDVGEKDMASGSTVADFVRWSRNTFPARHYALILWGHGYGPTRLAAPDTQLSCGSIVSPDLPFGFKAGTSDDSTPGPKNVLYGRELEDALKCSLNGDKLDLLVFDECVMGMMENAYALRDVVNVMVASEELIPDTGFDNADWLSRLEKKPQMSAQNLGEILVESYARSYRAVFECFTMSAVDVRRISQLGVAVSHLADALVAALPKEREAIRTARAECVNYGGPCAFAPCLHSIDLRRFCEVLSQRTSDHNLQDAAAAVVSAVQVAVLRAEPKQPIDARGANGLAIYFPPDADSYCSDRVIRCAYERDNRRYPLDFVNNERWTIFLHEYLKYVNNINDVNAQPPATCTTPQSNCDPFP